MTYERPDDPHAELDLEWAGPRPEDASATVILLHGRNRTAKGILKLSESLGISDVAYVAPQAAGRTWYPGSFLLPLEKNEPAFSSGLRALDRLVSDLEARSQPPEKTVLVGFSQGACVAAEYVARRPRRYGGLSSLIGGFFGPEGTTYDGRNGDLRGTPVFLGASDPDPYVPPARVRETAAVLHRMGAEVELSVRADAGHVLLDEDVERTRGLVRSLLERPGVRREVAAA